MVKLIQSLPSLQSLLTFLKSVSCREADGFPLPHSVPCAGPAKCYTLLFELSKQMSKKHVLMASSFDMNANLER